MENINNNNNNTMENINNTEADIIKNLSEKINWQEVHNLICRIGKNFDSKQERFIKALFIEKGIASYSSNYLKYVGNEKDGCDFLIEKNNSNIKIEMKYITNAFYTDKTFKLKKDCGEIKLMNSNGNNKHKELPNDYADYLLVVGRIGAGIISKKDLELFTKYKGDSISANIPCNKFIMVSTKNNIQIGTEKEDLNIKNKFNKFIQDTIENKKD
jgi:hypothetical protein